MANEHPRSPHRGDEVSVELTDGYATLGTFVRQDERYVTVTGTVGDANGKEILVPHTMVRRITILRKRR